jgi:hypothetical protein
MITMDFDIIKITNKTKKKIVLCYKDKVINQKNPIWQKGPDDNPNNGIMFPAAFRLNSLKNQNELPVLEVTVRIPNKKRIDKFKLICLYEKRIELFSGETNKSNVSPEFVVFTVKAKIDPDGFFSITGEKLYWQVKCINTNEVSELKKVNLEFYWLYSHCYDTFKRGIPVEILRELARACWISDQFCSDNQNEQQTNFNNQKSSIKQWITEAVVNYCFFRNPPFYNLKNLQPSYTKKSCSTNTVMITTFKLKKYLNPTDGDVCNCLDQAAILFYYLRCIGITDISFYCINHFGFLKYTRLIGRGYCNNPKEGNLVVDQKENERKPFGNHWCCYLKGFHWILDSCIGPHTGGENYHQYRKNAMDKTIPILTTPLEYPTKTKLEVIMYVDTIPQQIQISKPESISNKEFLKDNGLLDEALQRMQKNIQVSIPPDPIEWEPLISESNWVLLFEDLIPGYEEIIKTWKLKKDKGWVNIDLHVFNVTDPLKNTMSNFLYTYLTTLPEIPFKIISNGTSGIYYVYFPDENTHDYFLLGYANYIVMIQSQNVDYTFLNKVSNWFEQKFRETETVTNTSKRYVSSPLGKTIISKRKLNIDETVFVKIPCHANILYDFMFKLENPKSMKPVDIVLQLIDEGVHDGKHFFEFKAVKRAKNTLVISAVDNEKFWVWNREFTIIVDGDKTPDKHTKKGGKRQRQTKNK